MMCVGNVPSQLVELSAADGADGCAGGRGVSGRGSVGGVASGRFEGGETCAKGDVEERARW